MPNWQIFAYCVVVFWLFGWRVFYPRIFCSAGGSDRRARDVYFIFNSAPELYDLHRLHLVLFLMLAWVGADDVWDWTISFISATAACGGE